MYIDYRQALEELKLTIQERYPAFNIRVKDTSVLMRLISWGLLLFNKKFLTGYVTTIGNTVYIPKHKQQDFAYLFYVLAHEWVHIEAYNSSRLLHGVRYLFPQVLSVFSLLSILALTGNNWWLLSLLWSLCLLPLPAPFRAREELKAYTMSLAAHYWALGNVTVSFETYIAQQFTGPAYYYMWPFKRRVATDVHLAVVAIEHAAYANVYPFDEVKRIVNAHKETNSLFSD